MQRAQQPALLERAVGRVGVQQLPKDQRLGLGHLPDHRRHGVALQPAEAADPFGPSTTTYVEPTVTTTIGIC